MAKIRLEMEEQLFRKLVILCLDNKGVETLDELWVLLDDKIERMVRHELYSDSKTAPTEAEREKARQEYLDRVGIPAAFRWGKDFSLTTGDTGVPRRCDSVQEEAGGERDEAE